MYKKILVPLDGSELAECVLPHVESIAKGCGAQNVIFLRVVEPFQLPTGADYSSFSTDFIERMDSEHKAAAESYLSQLVSKNKYDGVNVKSEVIIGRLAADAIADYATKNDVDLITISTHGRSGISRWVMGSVADRILRSSCVPVMMVRAPGCVPGI